MPGCSVHEGSRATTPLSEASSLEWFDVVELAGAALRSVECHLRHPARTHPGPRQAGGRARPGGAPAPARCSTPQRAWMGDAALARARRLGHAGRFAGPAHQPGRRRAQRRSSAADSARPRSSRRRRNTRGVGCSQRSRRPGADRPRPQETAWTTPLEEDFEHTTYDPTQVATYFAAATRAALVLAALALRTGDAPHRSTPGGVRSTWR